MWLKARLLQFAEDLRGSYWFVPTLLALAGLLAGPLLVYVDAVLGEGWLGEFKWFYASRPAGARELLSTVAGSTITVAGVVFSITLAAVTYASGQYGPRLLTNFTRDRGNQVTLGIFIGTFLYCLIVLRTIRSAEETSADTGGAVREAFVPHLALLGALALAILSIGVLIYFVDHVTDSIHINNVVARIGNGLLAQIEERRTEAKDLPAARGQSDSSGGVPILATKTGYVEGLDESALLAVATERDVILTVLAVPGDFVHRGRPLLLVHPGGVEEIAGCVDLFSISRKRLALQDLRVPLDELVEIAARALSPGVNDPFTAIGCIDWLGAALSDLATMPVRPGTVWDNNGNARLVVPRHDFAEYLRLAVGQLRPYAARDPNAAAHLMHTLEVVRSSIADVDVRDLLSAEQRCLAQAIQDHERS